MNIEVIITNEVDLDGITVNALRADGTHQVDEFGHHTVEIYVESYKEGKMIDHYYERQHIETSLVVCTLTPEGKFIHQPNI